MEQEEDIYYWRKHSRPSLDQDHIRHSLAEYVLHPLKTRASILKSTYIPILSNHLHHEYPDFQSDILYSLNRKRRWEGEDSIGVDLLEKLTQLNNGWRVTVVERKQARNYEFPLCFAAAFYLYSHYFEDLYPVMKFCYLNDSDEYKEKSVKSSRQRDGYCNRLDRKKDRCIQLRYEELENLDGIVWNDGLNDDDEEAKVKYYNLEDHLVEKFVMVKRRKLGKKQSNN